jgi:hypothetical protein
MHRLPATFLALLLVASAARAEIIDRILAVVEGQMITLSDVRGVIRLGLETVPPGGDPIAQVLDKLLERQLMLVEVDRYAPPEPALEAIEARLREIRAKFPDALAVETTLHQIGMTQEDVRRYVRDTLRIEAYLEQRFTATIQPSDDEIAAYYRLNEAAFTRGGALVPYAQARTEARARLIQERRATLIRDWLAGLRRRANIVQLYYTQPPPGGVRNH